MTLLINIALLILSSTAALSAFGGDTWHKGNKPLYLRITQRGYISLLCLTLTLIVGIAKEVHETKNKIQSDLSQKKLESDLTNANNTLSNLRETLSKTREQLAEQNRITLLSTLASGYQATDSQISFTFRKQGNSFSQWDGMSNPHTFFSRITKVAGFESYLDALKVVIVGFGGFSISYEDEFKIGPNNDYLSLAGNDQSSSIYFPKAKLDSHLMNPANIFAELQHGDFGIEISFSKEFADVSEAKKYFSSKLPNVQKKCFSRVSEELVYCGIDVPPSLGEEIGNFWQQEFMHAESSAILNEKAGITINQKYTLDKVDISNSKVNIRFKQREQPKTEFGILYIN
ncbi:hypothetical protein [Pseudoalteromonas sp. XMcav11-Q]|uniref:hypothetical protein n=1 Tax=Pseudoalteromonas sp. XMcav11-Q TaxID=3136665 RepID=UPI0032C3E77B